MIVKFVGPHNWIIKSVVAPKGCIGVLTIPECEGEHSSNRPAISDDRSPNRHIAVSYAPGSTAEPSRDIQ